MSFFQANGQRKKNYSKQKIKQTTTIIYMHTLMQINNIRQNIAQPRAFY